MWAELVEPELVIEARDAFAERALRNIRLDGHSALMPAARITFAHFSLSSTTSFPKSAGEPGTTVPPRSASRAFTLGSARAALISLLSLSTISAGVAFGAQTPNQAHAGPSAVEAGSWKLLSLPNCAVEVLVHARRHGLVVLIGNVFAYHLRVQEAVTANAAMPLVVGEDVRTPLGAFRVVFRIRHLMIHHNPNSTISVR